MTFSAPIVIIGIGEMGGVFARAFLRTGHVVVPVTRGVRPASIAATVPSPRLVLVAVGEADLQPVLSEIPAGWESHLCLIQNELLPRDWERHDIVEPTIAPVWFEKKPGRPVGVVLPTPTFGPGAELVASALESIVIPAEQPPAADLVYELVKKNLYILTANIAGLVTGGSVGALWDDHRDLAVSVAAEILDIQQQLTGTVLDRPRLLQGLAAAFAADPDHGATGRSAPVRLARAIGQAAEFGVPSPRLDEIAATTAGATS